MIRGLRQSDYTDVVEPFLEGNTVEGLKACTRVLNIIDKVERALRLATQLGMSFEDVKVAEHDTSEFSDKDVEATEPYDDLSDDDTVAWHWNHAAQDNLEAALAEAEEVFHSEDPGCRAYVTTIKPHLRMALARAKITSDIGRQVLENSTD